MPTQRKIFTVQNLVEKFKQARGLVLSDYRGLNVEKMNELRKKIKQAGGEFEVVKNTLLGLAARQSGANIDTEALREPNVALWLYQDEIGPIKALFQFIQTTQLPKVKTAVLDGLPLSLEKLEQLASLSDRSTLQTQLVATFYSPVFGLVNALNWNLLKLALIFKTAVAKGGEENG